MDLISFRSQEGTTFSVPAGPAGAVTLRLDQVVDHLASPSAEHWPAGSESFSLYFTGPTAPILRQGMYPASAIGVTELFLVPIGRVPGGVRYEAVFSRLPESLVLGAA